MAQIETWFNQDLKRPVKVHYLDGNVFSLDSSGNIIGVNVFDNGASVNVSGTVSASVIRSDGATVAVAGSSSGNRAYVALPQSALTVPGVISIVIKLTSGGTVTTLCAIVANVYQSSTDTAVDPGTIIPSIQALITEIENVAASIPLDYSDLSQSFSNKVPINDYLETAITPAYTPLDTTGVTTTGKAWRTNKTEVSGSQYKYITYNFPASYAGNIIVVYGHGWGDVYPVASFYDSSMNFICGVGLRGDTDYKGLPVVIPSGAVTVVVNGRSDSAFPVGVSFFTLIDYIAYVKKIGVYGRSLTASLLEQLPSTYTDVRSLPTNCVYSIASDAYSHMTNLPNELNTYATIIKVNGANSAQLSAGTAYNLYICANENSLWIGFENANALVWRMISSSIQPAKKYLFIGDSYGDGYSHDGSNSGWCTYLATEMGLSSSQYEAQHSGGSAFSNGGFLARLNAATGSGFTDVVVLGGFNDYGATASDIDSGISTFCARVKALFPNAKIHIGCVGWIKQGTGESAYQNWQEVRSAITGKVLPVYQTCAKYGAQYINFSEYLLTDALMTPTDGYHPGEDGNKAIAHGVVNTFGTGCACLPFNIDLKG